MATSLPNFPSFDVDTDKTTLGVRWKNWLEKLENYMIAFNITDEGRKKATLLHLAGDYVLEIASTIDFTPLTADQATNRAAESVYAATKRSLNGYFCATKNQEFNIYLFRQSKRATDESIKQFNARLRTPPPGLRICRCRCRNQISGHPRLEVWKTPPLGTTRLDYDIG